MPLLPLITETHELASQLDNPALIVLDLRDVASYGNGHIPGAINFSLAEVMRAEPPVLGLLSTEQTLSLALSRIGYSADKHIVAVDDNGGPQAARLLWTLEAFGINNASFLNGGMVAWNQDIHLLDKQHSEPAYNDYQAQFSGKNSADRDDILANLDNPHRLLVDARTRGEYCGKDVRSARGGHIPGAVHFEWSQLKAPDMKLKPLAEIQAQLNAAGIGKDKEIVAYCQSHMRSSVLCLVLRALGYPNVKGYPGAWSDWGNQKELPIAQASQ